MAFDKDAFLSALDTMTVMELNDLVKAIEEKFGVSAAAMAAPAAGGGHCVFRKAIDQRTGHLVCGHFKAAACHCTAGQGVFQHAQRHAFAAGIDTQLRHVSDRDTTVFRHHERLSFSGEGGHFINDSQLLTAIQTQGLLLKNALSDHSDECASLQRPTVRGKNHVQRDRHLRWHSLSRVKP